MHMQTVQKILLPRVYKKREGMQRLRAKWAVESAVMSIIIKLCVQYIVSGLWL